MKVFKQNNINDCGISVIQSLYHHHYKKELNKQELISNCNISKEGLSILDLEQLAKKYGLNFSSYEINFEEFQNYSTKDYFVLLINQEGLLHYVVAKKQQDFVYIYDSNKGKIKISYEELKKVFLNILILVDKTNKKLENYLKKIKNKEIIIDYQKIAFIFFVNFLILGLNILNGYIIRSIFNNVISTNEISNLGIIVFVSVFSYLTLNLGQFIISVYENRNKFYLNKSLTNLFFESLLKKENNFFSKIFDHQILMIKVHINNITDYYCHHLNKWLISFFNFFLFFSLILFIKWEFGIILVLSSLVQLVYSIIELKFRKKNVIKMTNIENSQKKLYFLLEKFVFEETNYQKLLYFSNEIKNSVFYETLLKKKVSFFQSILYSLNNFVYNIINLIIYSLGAYFLFKNSLETGTIILISNFYVHTNKALNEVINFYFAKVAFNYSDKHFFNFININTIDESKEGINWNKIQRIDLKNLSYFRLNKKIFYKLNLNLISPMFIEGTSGIGKSTLYNLITNKIQPNKGSIMFDDVKQSSLNQQQFNENIIYQTNKSFLSKYNWNTILKALKEHDRETVVKIAYKLNLEINNKLSAEELSSGQVQYLNFLQLLNEKNKLIILDEALSNINKTNKQEIIEKLFPIIIQNNFLLFSDHDFNLKNYFKNKVNLNEIVSE